MTASWKRRGAVLAVLCALWAAAPAAQAIEPYWSNWRGLAIRGYDPVAYQIEGRPVEGRGEHALKWRGATWRFASASNRERFEAEPERYAPRYGGYCAYAVANGYTASVDPDAWKIVDGRLYLNYSRSIQAEWEKDVAGHIERADRNWPGLLAGGG